MIDSVGSYLVQVLFLTVKVLVLLLLPTFLVGGLIQLLTSALRNNASRLFGQGLFVYGTFLGVVIHELGHAFFCKVFGHKITDMKLFSPDQNGTLGYVTHSFDPKSFYQKVGNFFIGIGPIWFGSFVIFILTKFLFPQLLSSLVVHQDGSFLESCWLMFTSAFSGFSAFLSEGSYKRWSTYLWLYLVISIGFHLTLSKPDLEGAKSGLVTLVSGVVVVNLLTAWMDTPLLLMLGNFRSAYSILFFTLSLVFVCSGIFLVFNLLPRMK